MPRLTTGKTRRAFKRIVSGDLDPINALVTAVRDLTSPPLKSLDIPTTRARTIPPLARTPSPQPEPVYIPYQPAENTEKFITPCWEGFIRILNEENTPPILCALRPSSTASLGRDHTPDLADPHDTMPDADDQDLHDPAIDRLQHYRRGPGIDLYEDPYAGEPGEVETWAGELLRLMRRTPERAWSGAEWDDMQRCGDTGWMWREWERPNGLRLKRPEVAWEGLGEGWLRAGFEADATWARARARRRVWRARCRGRAGRRRVEIGRRMRRWELRGRRAEVRRELVAAVARREEVGEGHAEERDRKVRVLRAAAEHARKSPAVGARMGRLVGEDEVHDHVPLPWEDAAHPANRRKRCTPVTPLFETAPKKRVVFKQMTAEILLQANPYHDPIEVFLASPASKAVNVKSVLRGDTGRPPPSMRPQKRSPSTPTSSKRPMLPLPLPQPDSDDEDWLFKCCGTDDERLYDGGITAAKELQEVHNAKDEWLAQASEAMGVRFAERVAQWVDTGRMWGGGTALLVEDLEEMCGREELPPKINWRWFKIGEDVRMNMGRGSGVEFGKK